MKPTVAFFQWTCPNCDLRQTEEVDKDLGPFCTVVCESCQHVFDDLSLSRSDTLAWDKAIEELE